MKRAWHLLTIGLVALAAWPGGAMACDLAPRADDATSIYRHARDLIRRSAAIIDAEVIAPTWGDGLAQLRPIRVLKGPARPIFLVATPSNCDIAFTRAGDRVRVVLSGGPEHFVATQQDNGLDFPSTAGPRRLERALADLLGVPLPADFVAPGNEEPPPSR